MQENKAYNYLITHGASFFVGFIFGLVSGWIIHRIFVKKISVNWERTIISVVVLLVWAISVVLDIVVPTYSTPTAVHAIMGLVTGYFFEGNILEAIGKNKKK